jgi:hypothetical protein
MAKVNKIEFNINVDEKSYEKKFSKCIKLANELERALDKLKEVEIGVEVVHIKKKWYQFWKK